MEDDSRNVPVLRVVEGHVGLLDQPLARLGARRLGDADAHGAPAEGAPREVVERARDRERAPAPPVREQRHELVAAYAVDRPLGPDGLLQKPARFAQVLVARLVPLGVVDPLEPVEVDRHQGERRSALGPSLHRHGQVIVEGAVIPEPREAVRSRRDPQGVDLRLAHPAVAPKHEREQKGDEDQLDAGCDHDHGPTAETASLTKPCFRRVADTVQH